jgi:hypothetical protein
MTDAEINKVIESVILVLLGEDLTREQSLQEHLQEVVDREAARMAVGRDMTPAGFEAVETIVNKINLPQSVVDFAIGKCLEIYEREKKDFFSIRTDDALGSATRLIYCGASRNVIEKVISAVAEHGWFGRIENITRELLGRGLTPTEVKALVRHYVNNKGCRCREDERELLRMAQEYMSPEDVAEAKDQIRCFAIEFENFPD